MSDCKVNLGLDTAADVPYGKKTEVSLLRERGQENGEIPKYFYFQRYFEVYFKMRFKSGFYPGEEARPSD